MSWKWCPLADAECLQSAAYDWQTLIGAIVAIAAAAVAVWAVKAQLSHSARQERGRLEARDRASRAVMPWALNAVVNYADETASALINLHKAQTGEGDPFADTPKMPRLVQVPPPVELLPVFERLIEATQSEAVADRLADIIAEVQILDARLKSDGVSIPNPRGLILGPLGLRAVAATLFQYARRETNEPQELTWAWVRNASQLNPATRNRDWVMDTVAKASSMGYPILAVERGRAATDVDTNMMEHPVMMAK